MGKACINNSMIAWLCERETADYISFFGIIINAFLAWWIVRTIQTRLTNKRVLKDHFISEIKEIRNEYKACLSNLYSDRTYSNTVLPWFKLMNIKVSSLMEMLNNKYGIDEKFLNPYQEELRELVTNNDDFMNQFRSSNPIVFSTDSKNVLIKFQQNHYNLFNDLIVLVNDAN